MKHTISDEQIPTGFSTLLALEHARHFNAWMFGDIRLYLKGNILEIGSGIGNISTLCIGQKIPLSISDYDPVYYHLLQKKFGAEPYVKGIYSIDLADRQFGTTYAELLGTFDTVFALNVIEHIKEESQAISNCHKLLTPGGRLILLVPAWPSLYNCLDKGLDHFRRYTPSSMRKALSGQFSIVRTKYFNLAGIFGWWLIGTILRRKEMSSKQVGLYSKLVPLLRLADRLTFHKLGLSLVTVAEKK
ncbi:MAG: methyltransferase [Chitinophagaceae bacterium]|nr:methyltransferase [Chitinophagaceae bacterium]